MSLSVNQDRLYWREWGKAVKHCKASGLDAPDRHELHVKALGVDKSHKDFTNSDFNKILGVFRAVSQPGNLNAQKRQIEMPRKNVLVRIEDFEPGLVKHFLAQRFTFAVWLRRTHPQYEGATISKGTKAKPARNPAPDWIVAEYRESGPHDAPTLEDLNAGELAQLRNTLAREAAHERKQPERAVTLDASGNPDWT
jgi:hypothetical protein